jgi:hypothetical protein
MGYAFVVAFAVFLALMGGILCARRVDVMTGVTLMLIGVCAVSWMPPCWSSKFIKFVAIGFILGSLAMLTHGENTICQTISVYLPDTFANGTAISRPSADYSHANITSGFNMTVCWSYHLNPPFQVFHRANTSVISEQLKVFGAAMSQNKDEGAGVAVKRILEKFAG